LKQVIQNFKTGRLFVDEVPAPSLSSGFVLVQNQYSLISAGTERSTVSTAKASLLGKARQRPDLVKQVLETLKKEGWSETLKRVRTKLETLKELGYSSAGTILLSMDTNNVFKPGDRVACGGGGYASHSGIIAVPQNLAVKLPDSVPLDDAAFTTLGAIAMQGVRQADPKLGDFVCVIGLGLLGQITAQILRANGCQVLGIDTSVEMAKLGKEISCHTAMNRSDPELMSALDSFTEGHGFDAVIIAAATQSDDPVQLSTAILRPKGIIVIVGAVPMNVPREPYFYKKELELKISCSYGPGRYDHAYEEEGRDYPYGYVRWTENRNMAAFVKLLEKGSVQVKPLVTHTFDIDQAERAYDIITGKVPERHVAILLRYEPFEERKILADIQPPAPHEQTGRIGFIGAGSFAQKFLIPFAGSWGTLATVVTSRGITAKNVGEKFKFGRFSTEAQDVLTDPTISSVFIATRHNTHGKLVVAALEAKKHVFVEKPLTIHREDLDGIAEVYRRQSGRILMAGFNRRFSPLGREAKKFFTGHTEPLVVNYRVNAGFIPRDHWTQTEEGGGRILGEVCHFIDFMQFVTGSNPVGVFAECISSPNAKTSNRDNVALTIRFKNGSIGVITYLACGDKRLPKERIEIFGGGKSFMINDFRDAESYTDDARRKIKKRGKGHREEVEAFFKSIREGLPSPIPFESIYLTTAATFGVIDSLQTGLPQSITPS
jgi:predicted dehydrogenase/threonine dehydrogenase-like Zn-dependent dehydrogenase